MPDLNDQHPDFARKPGEKLTLGGREYTFGQNQFTSFWRAGPKDGTVVCSRDYPHGSSAPYVVNGAGIVDLDKAADRARAGAKRTYEQALEVVRRYEAEK